LFKEQPFISAPIFGALAGQPPTESLCDFSLLDDDALALALAAVLDADDTAESLIPIQSTTGAPPRSWRQVPQQKSETHRFPEFTECRPEVSVDDTDSKFALATDGEDLLLTVPDVVTLFPNGLLSSMNEVPRVVPAANAKDGAASVVEPQLQAYYGGCQVCQANRTGVFIELACEISSHWATYGLMVQSPDDFPLCRTEDVCIHNYFKRTCRDRAASPQSSPQHVSKQVRRHCCCLVSPLCRSISRESSVTRWCRTGDQCC
jgi:hypothetical protein